MGWNRLVTATLMASCGVISINSNALADEPPNAPIIAAPGSNQSSGGPTVWNANQEVSALGGPRQLDPEFQAKGIPLGVFRLFTNLQATASYDDNVFRQPTIQNSDVFFTEIPTLILDYATNNAHLNLYADGTFTQYDKYSTVNTQLYDFGLKGLYDVTREVEVSGNVSYSQLAEQLSSANTVHDQAAPTLYTLFDASGQVSIKPNRLGFVLGGSNDQYVFFNTPLFGGGSLQNRDRDNTVEKGFAEANYDFSPGYSAYVKGTYNNDEYALAYDRTLYHRDSHGYQVDAGVNLLLGDLVQGTAYVGYVDQLYSHHQPFHPTAPLPDISGFDFGADLTWYPTELLTLQLQASRQIVNTTFAGASGGDDRNMNLSAIYEMSPQLFFNANFGYDNTDYKGAVPAVNESTPTFGVGVKYLVNHYAQVQLNYTYATRDSSISQLNYDDNLVSLGLNLQI